MATSVGRTPLFKERHSAWRIPGSPRSGIGTKKRPNCFRVPRTNWVRFNAGVHRPFIRRRSDRGSDHLHLRRCPLTHWQLQLGVRRSTRALWQRHVPVARVYIGTVAVLTQSLAVTTETLAGAHTVCADVHGYRGSGRSDCAIVHSSSGCVGTTIGREIFPRGSRFSEIRRPFYNAVAPTSGDGPGHAPWP